MNLSHWRKTGEEWQKQAWLLISAKPAPNGELHFGHLAGPFLTQDIWYRFLTGLGADVCVMSGTDPIDSFIALKASTTNTKADALANDCYDAIVSNFKRFDFHYDCFVNLLDNDIQQAWLTELHKLHQAGTEQGYITEQLKPFPFVEEQGASGAAICGDCPDCSQPVSGYFCESCGAHFDPAEIRRPVARSDKTLHFRSTDDQFFTIRQPVALVENLMKASVRSSELDIVMRQIEQQRSDIRLTETSAWGIPASDDRVWFGHGWLYAYCRLIGEQYKSLKGSSLQPFDAGSTVKSMNIFGVDNTVSHMVNIQGMAMSLSGHQGFSHFLVNHFYLLDGKKFSTSAGHVITASILDQVLSGYDNELSQFSTDRIRLLLAATSPASKEMDLTPEAFEQIANQLFSDAIMQPVNQVLETLSRFAAARFTTDSTDTTTTVSIDALSEEFDHLWREWEAAFDVQIFDPQQLVEILARHARVNSETLNDPESAARWLIEHCLLLQPLCPILALSVWQMAGLPGSPVMHQLPDELLVTTTDKRLPDVCWPTSLIEQFFQ